MANSREIIQSQKYKETHSSFDELMQMMDDNSKEGYDKAVRLTKQEIDRGRCNKKEMNKKAKTFINTPIYRSYHHSMTLILQIVQLMPRKSVKISDIILDKFSEVIRWSSAAYEQNNKFLKHNSLSEAISLMYTVKVCVNSASGINLIGKSKSEQLGKSIDIIVRQLVAWRGSLQDQGDDEER